MIGVLYPSNVWVSSKSTNQVCVHVDSAANSGVGVNDDRNWRSAGKLRDGPGFSQLALEYMRSDLVTGLTSSKNDWMASADMTPG